MKLLNFVTILLFSNIALSQTHTFSPGDGISASAINDNFTEIQNKAANKFITISGLSSLT